MTGSAAVLPIILRTYGLLQHSPVKVNTTLLIIAYIRKLNVIKQAPKTIEKRPFIALTPRMLQFQIWGVLRSLY